MIGYKGKYQDMHVPELYERAGILSVSQLCALVSIMEVFTIVQNGKPESLYQNMVCVEARDGNRAGMQLISRVKKVPVQSIFKRGYHLYNMIPVDYKKIKNRSRFKDHVTKWIKQHIKIRII